ncbi:MAG: NAD-dependent succinate-semialdehyde dehydrogenase [Chloroflexota bacterium]|nr:NAD-dependent succinate-semialdehyde dehydrogenase [Chloroflexota bacterium]
MAIATRRAIATTNPATGETVRTFEALDDVQIEQKLQQAAQAFQLYRKTSFAQRRGNLLRAAEILESEKAEFGRIITTEMGKTLKSAVAEVVKCAWGCRYYAENGERLLADEAVETDAASSYIHYQPIGVVLAVMPWNFPFWQVLRFVAPTLMSGNVALLKHASNVPQCALAIEGLLLRAGFPMGAFQTLLITAEQVSGVLEDSRVAAATLTGSEAAGSRVANEAGKNIKKTVLELGGSDPFIVMPSADLEVAAKTAVTARTINNGQSCIAAKRIIVDESIADDFERRFVQAMEALKVGDPMDEATDVGPLATETILADLDSQVRRSVEKGARLLTGGMRLDRPGNYYVPTVITDITEEAPAYAEEMFGPVASLYRVQGIDEAIKLANATTFGLGSSVWTNNQAERARFIDEIEAGQVFINGMVVSDPRLPFGGVKHSGYGRELGMYGIREFVNVKTVWIGDAGQDHGDITE